MDKKYEGMKLILTPKDSLKIGLDPDIRTLVKKIEKEKPQNFMAKELNEVSEKDVLKTVDLKILKEGKYSLDKLKEIAKYLKITEISKKRKKNLLDEIIGILENISYEED